MKPDLYTLPPAWQWQELGKVATLINGRAYKDEELLEDGPVPVLRVGNFFSNRGWYYSNLQLPEDKYCNKGDLLYAWSASFGPKIWDGEKAIYHYHIWKIITSPLLDKKYLYYLLASESENIKSAGNGIAMMHATKGGMEKRRIPLPPLAEQQKIAAILDAADSFRQKDQQLVERYTALSQSLFLEMFGDPVTNPNRWERRKISDVCHKVTDGTHQSPRFIAEGIPFLLVSNIVNNEINFKTKKFISEVDYDVLTKNTPIEKNDILYTSVGSYGNPAIVEADIKFCFQRHIAQLKPNHEIINVKFLHAMLLSRYVKNQADKLARGVAQKTLNLKEIKSIEIYLPNFTAQNEFAERIQLIETQKQQVQASLEKSEALFNSLLQRAFTGELSAKMAA